MILGVLGILLVNFFFSLQKYKLPLFSAERLKITFKPYLRVLGLTDYNYKIGTIMFYVAYRISGGLYRGDVSNAIPTGLI